MHESTHPPNSRPVLIAIGLIIAAYVVWLTLFSGGQTTDHASASHQDTHQVDHDDGGHGDHEGAHADLTGHTDHEGEQSPAGGDHGHGAAVMPHFWAVIPFVLLLGAIAVFPLIPSIEHWWESNTNRFLVAVVLAIITLLYYMFLYPAAGLSQVVHVLQHAVLLEYVPFIALLFSLYTISGGIRIHGDLVAKPLTNVGFLTVGGLLASFIGTTGAAMLLIRPLIETNNERKHIQHTIVFFIFVVCNCGGCLLPIGDPPLFLGYLKGVDFLWTMRYLWPPWLFANVLIIVVYYAWDRFLCYPRESVVDLQRDDETKKPIQVEGIWPNMLLLGGVIFAVALLDPNKAFPGTTWHPWPFLREVVQLLMVFCSLWLGSETIRGANKFNYHAIIEVAALFIGIFICMQPAIEILHLKGGDLGIDTPHKLFWATGSLSAVLDNAPTYVVFYETAASNPDYGERFNELVSESGDLANLARRLLEGISLGAVFMGAMTYIGNGPNFMVRAIAEQSGIRMPSFFGYVFRYSLIVLTPIFLITTWLLL